MAITHTGATGTAASSTSASSFTLTTATTAYTEGNFGILRVVTDNIATTDGATNDHTSVAGWTGTVTKLGEYTNTVGGAVRDGVTVSIWALECGAGGNAVGTVLTINLSAASTDKAASLNRYTKAAGTALQIAGSPQYTTADGTTAPGSLAISGLPNTQRLYVRGVGMEGNTTTALTPTANFTSQTTVRSRNNASAVSLATEFRANTSTGETSAPTMPISADSASVFVAVEEYSPAQTLTPPLVTNSNAFYAATVSQGGAAQSLTPALYTNTSTFYAPTVAAGAVTLTPSIYSNANAFYAPTVTPGAVTLAPALYTNSATFYAPSIGRGAVTLSPTLLASANAFYSPSVAAGSVTLSPALFSNASSFYAATVSQGSLPQTLTPSLFTNTATFYSATVAPGAITLAAPILSNANAFYAPTVTGQITLSPALLSNVNSFPAATVSRGSVALLPSLAANDNTFFPATVAAVTAQDIAPERFDNVVSFYAAIVARALYPIKTAQTYPGTAQQFPALPAQSFPLAASADYPLAGASQDYPLRRAA